MIYYSCVLLLLAVLNIFLDLVQLLQVFDDVIVLYVLVKVYLAKTNMDDLVLLLILFEDLLLLGELLIQVLQPNLLLGLQVLDRLLIQWIVYHQLIGYVIRILVDLTCGAIEHLSNCILLFLAVRGHWVPRLHLLLNVLLELAQLVINVLENAK